jgi:hypothetical protein
LFRKSDPRGSLLTCDATDREASSFSPDGGRCAAIGYPIKKQNLVKMFEKLLTAAPFYGFMYIDETRRQGPRRPRQASRSPPLLHRHPPRLLAPAPHPPSLRLRRLRPRRGPSHLRVDRLLSRRPHQADQPPPRTETPRRTVAAQLSQTQSHLGQSLCSGRMPMQKVTSLERICELNHQRLLDDRNADR